MYTCSHMRKTPAAMQRIPQNVKKNTFSFEINLARMVTVNMIKMGIWYPTVIFLHLLCIFSSRDEGYM